MGWVARWVLALPTVDRALGVLDSKTSHARSVTGHGNCQKSRRASNNARTDKENGGRHPLQRLPGSSITRGWPSLSCTLCLLLLSLSPRGGRVLQAVCSPHRLHSL
jgi:hypothetical protein